MTPESKGTLRHYSTTRTTSSTLAAHLDDIRRVYNEDKTLTPEEKERLKLAEQHMVNVIQSLSWAKAAVTAITSWNNKPLIKQE